LRGVETVALRMGRRSANASAVAAWLDHPQSQLTPAEQQATSVTDYVRLSIGIEHIDDILAHLGQAPKAAA
jgi:O-acetylhomoserine (thiol)-lyase